MTSAFTWAFGFLIGATAGWICRARQLPMGPPKGSYGPRRPGPYNSHPRGIEPSAPGMRRIYYDMPSTIAECGGPCAAGPRHCDCGALWRDEPVRLDPGNVQRGNGSGGPTTPKPKIVNPLTRKDPPEAMTVEDWVFRSSTRMLSDQTKPQPPYGRVFDGYGRCIGYIPHPKDDTSNSPQTDQ